jgi:dihydroflavonol-4-reductase
MDEWVGVTGGAGFIGSHLVSWLVDSGHNVRVIERPGASVEHLPVAVRIVFADIRDRRATVRALEGTRWVYHVLDAALAQGAERVLHTSTESILTKTRMTGPIDENIEIALEDAVGPYCRSKLLAEQYAFGLAAQGKPVVVANPTMPVGPGDRGLSPPTRLIVDFCTGKLPATMDCSLNLIDVRDVAIGLTRVMERGKPGRRYLLGHENLMLCEFLEILSELTGARVPTWRVPFAVAIVAAWLSEKYADHWSGRSPKATLTGVRLARRIMHFDPSRSLEELALVPRPIEQSLSEAVTWLESTGLIRCHAGALRRVHPAINSGKID